MNRDLKNMYETLCQSIKDEVLIYESMVGELKRKQKAIIEGEIDQLKEAVRAERDIAQEVLTLVDQRTAISKAISISLGLNPAEITLKKLLNNAEPNHEIILTEMRYQLKSNAHQISTLNQDNKYLLSASISHVRGLVNLFLQDDSKTDNRYEGTGMMTEPSDDHRVLDFQI